MVYDAIIVGAGNGVRAQLGYNKVFFEMRNGKTVLDNACKIFLDDPDCARIIVVTNPDNFDKVTPNEKIILIEGGKMRQDSVANGLKQVVSDYVFVHDACRPFVKENMLGILKKEVVAKKAVILAKKATDTVKKVIDGKIINTIDRNYVYLAETPQCFESELLKKAYEYNKDSQFTDEASAVEAYGHDVYVIENNHNNTKLTIRSDFNEI